jgi:hypothetical protein
MAKEAANAMANNTKAIAFFPSFGILLFVMFLLLLVTMAFSMVVIVAISFTEKKN